MYRHFPERLAAAGAKTGFVEFGGNLLQAESLPVQRILDSSGLARLQALGEGWVKMRLLTGVQLQGRLILRNSFLISLVLEGLSNTDDLFLLPVHTYNELNVNYNVDLFTLYIRDKKRTKRTAL